VLDVGANIGYTARVLARAIDPGGVVYAFEPEPFNYRMLQRTATRPEFDGRIVTWQCAIGAEDSTAQLWLNTRHPADHRVITSQFRPADPAVTRITVPIVSIDSFLERNPGPVSFIKIDVQGFEQPVCEGMKKTLEQNPRLSIVMEYAPAMMRELGFSPTDLIQLLIKYGFKCYLIGPKGTLSRGIPSGIDDSDYVDLLFNRRSLTDNGGI
jgi:FkbM family methyltransferase